MELNGDTFIYCFIHLHFSNDTKTLKEAEYFSCKHENALNSMEFFERVLAFHTRCSEILCTLYFTDIILPTFKRVYRHIEYEIKT